MHLTTLEGFLTALVIGPKIVMPSQWIPWIWDRIDGQVAPPFEDTQQPVMRGTPKVGRNEPCPCGSGQKYKTCCGGPSGAVH
jgi:uncharacterized protein YecA (UPF0149 family)